MKHLLIFLFFSSFFLPDNTPATQHRDKSIYQAGGAKKLYEITTANNALTKGLNNLVCDVFNDTLYFVNNGRLIKMSLKNGKLSTDGPLNTYLAQQRRLHHDAARITVAPDGYFIDLGTELDLVSTTGAANVIFKGKSAILDDVPENDHVLLASTAGVELLNMQGKKLDGVDMGLGGIGFYHASHGLGNADDPAHIAEFTVDNSDRIKKTLYPSTDAFKAVSNSLYVAYSDDHYFFLYDDASRDNIFVVKKGEKKIWRTIALGKDCSPSGEELQNEEGSDPNFRVIPYEDGFYIIAFARKKLEVLSFRM